MNNNLQEFALMKWASVKKKTPVARISSSIFFFLRSSEINCLFNISSRTLIQVTSPDTRCEHLLAVGLALLTFPGETVPTRSHLPCPSAFPATSLIVIYEAGRGRRRRGQKGGARDVAEEVTVGGRGTEEGRSDAAITFLSHSSRHTEVYLWVGLSPESLLWKEGGGVSLSHPSLFWHNSACKLLNTRLFTSLC